MDKKETMAEGVVQLTLRSADGAGLPAWEPGAHIDLVLADDVTRQYSLCGDPAERSVLQVAVLREQAGRGGSLQVHDTLAEGDTVHVRGPRNHFALKTARRYVFIAGGIGITPILAEPGVSADAAAVYCCGPEALVAAVEQECTRWPHGALNIERFTPRVGAGDGPRESFEIELAQTGTTRTVPADKSILDVLEASGIKVLSSCHEGTCGTCETAVLDGVPDHRDSVLTDEEQAANDTMMICVSRACSARLVLDL